MFAISARILARFGPWLGRLAKASPDMWAKIVKTVGARTAFVGNTVDELVTFAKASPANAAMTFLTIASLGVSIADLFDAEEVATPEGRKAATVLNMATLGTPHDEAMAMIYQAAAQSESLKSGLNDMESKLDVLQTVCTWARGHFGSPRAAVQAHSMAQAFFELPLAEVELGFRRLRV